jgi:hypothetical protein
MAKLWKMMREAKGKSQLQEIELQTLAISSPTVIYLTGFRTTDSHSREIAVSLLHMKRLLRDKSGKTTPPEIYAWSYSDLSNIFNLLSYNCRPEQNYSPTAQKLATSVIMPLVSENDQPLPRAEAQKRLRNVTFFGYSAGTIVAQEIFNASLSMMQNVGYTPEDARELLHEVVLVSAGNVSRQNKEQKRFTTLYLAGSDDGVIRWKDRLWSPRQYLLARQSGQLTIEKLSDTSLLITASTKKQKSSPHDLEHYTTKDDDHSQFSKIALHALINAVNRTTTLNVFQLLEPLASHTPQETAAYLGRIKRAMGKGIN